MNKSLLSFTLFIAMISTTACKQQSGDDDYNYRKAVEAFCDEDDNEKSLEMVNEILDNNPGHVDYGSLNG